MKRLALLMLAPIALAFLSACGGDGGADGGSTVTTVQDRGELRCGVKQTQPLSA